VITDLLFGGVSAIILISALFVVRSTDLIRAVLWLALSLLGTAALYALLEAPFLAGVQVLTYVGGVVTLMIFGVMVTRRHEGAEAKAESDPDERGFIAAAALLALLGIAIWKANLGAAPPAAPVSTAELARSLLDDYLLSFEAVSLVLLAAIVGAVVLARRKDPDPVTGRETAVLPARRPAVEPARQAALTEPSPKPKLPEVAQ
jgi:NADH-quinone oxidoreductase subunit J